MASESYSSVDLLMQYYGNFTNPGAQVPFNLALVRFPKDDHIVQSIDTIIKNWLSNLPENAVANWVVRVFRLYYNIMQSLKPMISYSKISLIYYLSYESNPCLITTKIIMTYFIIYYFP